MKSLFQPLWLGAAAVLVLAGCDTSRNATDASSNASTTTSVPSTPSNITFSRNLTQGDFNFQVQSASTESGGNQLTIYPRRGTVLMSEPVRLNIKGAVNDAMLGDLNADGNPELYIITNGSGTGASASGMIEAYEFVNRAFRPVQVPMSMSSDLSAGYNGQDKYMVQGNRIVRTFPLYKDGTATGGTRTIEYSMNPAGMLTVSSSSSTPGANEMQTSTEPQMQTPAPTTPSMKTPAPKRK